MCGQKQPTRALSARQARSCEEARGPRCRCRCGGELHGAKRNGDGNTPRAFFERLPEDDPHKLPPKTEQKHVQLSLFEAVP